MSFVYRDMLFPNIVKFGGYSSLHHRFKRVWGTKYIDNVHVYNSTLPIYSGSWRTDVVFKRFLNALGMSHEELISNRVDSDIESIWFYLKGGFAWDGSTRPRGTYTGDLLYTATNGLTAPTAITLASEINANLNVGEVLEVTVSYGGDLKRYIEAHTLEYEVTPIGIIGGTLNSSEIRDVLHSNPWYYFANCRHIEYTKDGLPFQIYDGNITSDGVYDDVYTVESLRVPLCKVSITSEDFEQPVGDDAPRKLNFGMFGLMGDTSVFTPFTNEDGSLAIYDEKISSVSTPEGEVLEYTYTVKYTYNGCNASSTILLEMMGFYDMLENLAETQAVTYTDVEEKYETVIHSTIDTAFKTTLVDEMTYDVTDSLYYEGHLRVDAVEYMKRRDFTKLIATKIATDYSVEEASWFEKAFAAVIVIAAFVVGILLAAPSGGTVTWGSVAAGLAAASAILTVGSFFLASFGGLSAQRLVNQIGAFAQVVGIAALITGIFAWIQAAGQRAAQEAAQQAMNEAIAAGATGDAIGTAALSAFEAQLAANTFMSNLVNALRFAVTDAMAAVSNVLNMFSGSTSASVSQAVGTVVDGIGFVNTGMEFYMDKEKEEMDAEMAYLEEEERKYNEEMLDNALKKPAEIWIMSEDRITSYDALFELDMSISSKIGHDMNFLVWESNVNAV